MNLRKLSYYLCIILITILLSGCTSNGSTHVEIESDIERYLPTMSSVQGFTLTAKVSPSQDENYEYLWSADSGSFIPSTFNLDNPSTSHQTESSKVLWSPDYTDPNKTSFEVTVIIKNSPGAEIAKDTIELIYDGKWYSLKK